MPAATATTKYDRSTIASAGVEAEAKILVGLIVSLGSSSEIPMHYLCQNSRRFREHGRRSRSRFNCIHPLELRASNAKPSGTEANRRQKCQRASTWRHVIPTAFASSPLL
jgi:hypothetical protein